MSRLCRWVGSGMVLAATALAASCAEESTEGPQGDSATAPAETPAASAASEAGDPVIVEVRGRHHVITAHSFAAGPVYTVRETEGKLLADSLSSGELASRHPELFEEIRALLADAESRLWAGRDTEPLEREEPGR